jgi:hypothetical protein
MNALAELARHAMTLAVPAELLLPAKLIAIAGDLEMESAAVHALIETVDVDAIVAASARVNGDESRVNPIARVEFPEAIVFGTVTDAGSISKGKSWGGRIVSVTPLLPTDAIHPDRITYSLKATSKQRQRWEWRDTIKALLGRDRRLVTRAMQLGKAGFLEQLTPADADLIAGKVDLDPAAFWVAVRHGDRLGPNAIEQHLQRLEERRVGYSFDFGSELVQIQPAA